MSGASAEDIQTRITTARREAEGLKDRIKRRKDDLGDTTRKHLIISLPYCGVTVAAADTLLQFAMSRLQERTGWRRLA